MPTFINPRFRNGPLTSSSTPNEKQAFDMIFGINGVVVQTQQNIDLFGESNVGKPGFNNGQKPINNTKFDPECTSDKRC